MEHSQSNLDQKQKKTDKEHILDNPDTYIGSIENVDCDLPVYNSESNTIEEQTFQYNPGLYKLFDEGIVNCRDHVIRMEQQLDSGSENVQPVTQIHITVQDNMISFYNNGNGIDIVQHPTYKVWIPEMIFGHLRTSTNYNKKEKKITGGKNGFGFKLVLIWSKSGIIETVDHMRELKYVQRFENNFSVIEKPKITKNASQNPTRSELLARL